MRRVPLLQLGGALHGVGVGGQQRPHRAGFPWGWQLVLGLGAEAGSAAGAVDSAGLVPLGLRALVFLIVRNRQQQLAHGAVGSDAWRMRAMA